MSVLLITAVPSNPSNQTRNQKCTILTDQHESGHMLTQNMEKYTPLVTANPNSIAL